MQTQIQNYNNNLEVTYKKMYSEAKDVWTHEEEMRIAPKLLLSLLSANRTHRILDIGCGAGIDTAFFASQGMESYGIDIVINKSWNDYQEQYNNANFAQQSIYDFHTQDILFDGILDNGCMHHHHPDTFKEYFNKIDQLLVKNGVLLISTFYTGVSEQNLDNNGRIMRSFTSEELKTLVMNNSNTLDPLGYKVIPRSQSGKSYLLYWFVKL